MLDKFSVAFLIRLSIYIICLQLNPYDDDCYNHSNGSEILTSPYNCAG